MEKKTIPFNLSDKPSLMNLLKEQPEVAKQVMQTFSELMEESISNKWHELPEQFAGKDLTFRELIKGILHGSLDLPDINPEAYDAIKEEVHPLSMLMPRKDFLNGGIRKYNWRSWFRLPQDAAIDQETISKIFRTLLRYYKYVKVEDLAYALINNQIATFKSMDQAKLLPFYPAIRYQQKHFGDLHVGKFFDEIGAFDCGTIPDTFQWEYDNCPSCQVGSLEDIFGDGEVGVCTHCNAGFKV